MSEITTQGPESAAPAQPFRPQDNIFRSFNALNPNIFEDLIGNLRSIRKGDISDHITIANDSGKVNGNFRKQFSSFETMQEFSTSIGLKGTYGVYSASASRSGKTEETSSFTTLHSTYIAELRMGTISLNALTRKEKLALLRPEMVKQLKNISSLADAQDFTNIWGTHLVTEVRTGGIVLVSNSVETGSFEMRETVSQKIEASYTKIASLEIAITRSSEVKEAWENISQSTKVRGGAVHLAAEFNSSGASIVEWAKSVTADTTYAIGDSIEIFTLAAGTARAMLKKYIDLTMLAFSLEHPIIFTGGINAPLNPKPVIARRAGKGFKTIGGGAAVTKNSNNFLIGSYPNTTNGGAPTGWTAASHDLILPTVASDMLTSYVITIHDPGNYLEIMVAQGKGSNTGVGADHAEATLPDGWILTCGGVFSDTIEGTYKFVTASYFKDEHTWAVASSDYKAAATNVNLHAYAIGIKSTDTQIIIKAESHNGTVVRGQHGSPSAVGSGFVCGGGINVTGNSGPGNLVQMNYPSKTDTWQAYNKDLDSSTSQARSQAFAISLHATIKI